MQHLRMPKFEPFCFLYSAAMILDTTPKDLIIEIGHDGWEPWWPTQVRNFHIEEIQDCCFKRNRALVNINPYPSSRANGYEDRRPIWPYIDAWRRFYTMFTGHRGILAIGTHAVAVNCGTVYDPNGPVWDLDPLQNNHSVRDGWFLV